MVGFFFAQGERARVRRIDIDLLSEEELIDLNHRIISRLRFLRDMRSHAEMLNFRVGEKVRFQPAGHPEVIGTLTRYNKKSVTVVAENGQRWNVHPTFLFKAASRSSERNGAASHQESVIPFRQPAAKKSAD